MQQNLIQLIIKFMHQNLFQFKMTDFKPQQPTRDNEKEQQKLAKKIKNFIYDPSDVIGSGFSSKVYKGINEQNNQQVAIKVIQLAKIQNEVEKYLLNNQINALRALNHKNILKTIDILMTKNNVYIVTEFCEFGDLQQMIKNNKKLQEKDALNIMRDIVEGYIAIEQKNIIHRDLKTANIFLTKSGAKIADFGFCQFDGQKKPQIAYNVGSPAYMSPQSYKQNKYSSKSDIWGIGIILAQMLLGETPQKNLTYTEMSNNLINGRVGFTQNEDIRQILLSCFRKDIRERIDAKTLLQNILQTIQKMSLNREEQKNQINPQVDSRYGKTPQMNPNDPFYSNAIQRQEVDNLRFSADEKKFLSVSPSKMNNPFPNQFEQSNRPFSVIQPLNLQQGNRSLSGKKEGLKSQIVLQTLNSQRMNESNNLKRLKCSIAMLQFVFRLFKYLSEVPIPIFSFLKLLLFRHRSYIEQVTVNLLEENRNDQNLNELFKEFQFLKKMFDSAYLDRQNSPQEEGNHIELMNTMNKLANLTLIDTQCINAYKDLIRRGCEDLLFEIDENRSNAFALWDYLMLEYEILGLYGEGLNDEIIATQKILLELILKQQPKNISKVHIELMRIKHRYLFQSGKVELSQPQHPNNVIHSHNLLVRHMSH